MSVLTIADSFLHWSARPRGCDLRKRGLQKVPLKMDDAEGCIALGFSKSDQANITLGARVPADGRTPMLYALKLVKPEML
jgi:hypothetical protein